MQRNRGKQENGKVLRSSQENWRYQGTIHAKMGTIKHRNGKDLRAAEETKKRWPEQRTKQKRS